MALTFEECLADTVIMMRWGQERWEERERWGWCGGEVRRGGEVGEVRGGGGGGGEVGR